MAEALADQFIAYGPAVAEFEVAVARLIGVPHAVALQSGTAALHLALIASGIQQGDEVLMPTLTYIATANAVRYVGAHPVFLDVEREYRQLDLDRAERFVAQTYRAVNGRLENKTTGRTLRAIVAVDLLGHPADMHATVGLARELGLCVIDDAAEALGAVSRGAMTGSIAPVSTLSFNANKIITSAGGGMLLAKDRALADRVRSLALHGKDPAGGFEPREVGFNYALGVAQATLGLRQLKRLDNFIARKRQIAARYSRAFLDEPSITVPSEASWASSTYWLYTVHVPESTRDALISELARRDIQTRPMFECIHRLAPHAASQAAECPVAEELSDTGVSLPCSTGMEDDALDFIIESVLEILECS